MNMTTAARLGASDDHRRQRLLSIAELLSRHGGGSIELKWPDQNEIALAENRRNFDGFGPNNSGIVAFEQQTRQHSAVARAGASFISLPVLQDAAVPSVDRGKAATWNGTAADATPALDLVKTAPKRLQAQIVASKALLRTSPILAAGFLEAQLLSAIAAAIDNAALNGLGDSEPVGLLVDEVVAEHQLQGPSITVADILEMEKALAAAHGEGDPSGLCWLADPSTRKALRATARTAVDATPAWPDAREIGPLGHRGIVSPFAPADTLILGNFADLLVIQSKGIEVMLNPYTRSDEGFVQLTVLAFFDVVALNPGHSFIHAIPAAI